MSGQRTLTVIGLPGLPHFEPGHSIAAEIAAAAERAGVGLGDGDVVVAAQKIVSKVEGRTVELDRVAPDAEAHMLADRTGRPAVLAQLIRNESAEVMRATPAAIVVRHRTGHVLANAGIDASNVGSGSGDERVLLWPEDPDASARTIRAELAAISGVRPAVIVADSLGRAWRMGTVGTAIGCAGLAVLDDRRGSHDLYGRELQATLVGVADSIAAAAVLVMGEGAEGIPVAIVKGAERWVSSEDGPGMTSGLRPVEQDMFR